MIIRLPIDAINLYLDMKLILSLTLSLVVLLFSSAALSQEEARAAWQITNFDITANIQQAERTLNVVAILTATNVGRGVGSSFTFRINTKASIKTVTVGGANANFRTVPESYGNLQRVTVTLPTSIAPSAPLALSINYVYAVESNTGLAAISPIGSQFLPLSFWYPTPNTPFTTRGADTAPVRLVVNSANVISSGVEKSGGAGSTVYEQPLNAQPFFVQGDWDKVEGTGESRNIAAFLPRGATAEEKKQAEAILTFAANARAYYASQLGPGPDVPIRLVSVRRGSGFNDAGTILIDPGAFRRAKLDSTTALLISEAVSRLWLGAQTAIRGDGGGLLRDGVTRFLAVSFLEKQFGREVAQEELLRERLAYSTVARRDAPLSRVTQLDSTYFNSVPNKGGMVWRLIEHSLGHDAFIGVLRALLQAGKGSGVGIIGIDLAGFRNALAERGGASTKTLMDQQFDQVTDLDLLIGVPQPRGNEWVSALRNLGSTDVVTTVSATTAGGERLSVNVTVPARNFSEAVFKTPSKIIRLEVDPEKLYPQLDYSNDSVPRTRDLQDALSEATRLLGAQDYVKAESIAREILAVTPYMQEARIILARALLDQNRTEEAEKLFRSALEATLPTPATLAWANVGLGESSLKKGQAAEAARYFTEAVRADAEYASSLAARAGRLKAETATNTLQVDGSVRAFIAQMDQAITSGKKVELEPRVVSGELVRFIGGVVGTQPEMWQTRVLRTEQLDANLVAADVSLDTKQLGKQQSGTALFFLTRAGSSWKLLGIDLFEVR
ncbi:MAG: tetratricopeptide repeat protein [Acidobacteriota bacterium]|nr:tetratricopeptide repeat protein [Acidobacteriota bacterium]